LSPLERPKDRVQRNQCEKKKDLEGGKKRAGSLFRRGESLLGPCPGGRVPKSGKKKKKGVSLVIENHRPASYMGGEKEVRRGMRNLKKKEFLKTRPKKSGKEGGKEKEPGHQRNEITLRTQGGGKEGETFLSRKCVPEEGGKGEKRSPSQRPSQKKLDTHKKKKGPAERAKKKGSRPGHFCSPEEGPGKKKKKKKKGGEGAENGVGSSVRG